MLREDADLVSLLTPVEPGTLDIGDGFLDRKDGKCQGREEKGRND
jgi:hypothetical protein